MKHLKLFSASAIFIAGLLAPATANSDELDYAVENNGNSLTVKQAYSEDGLPQPVVSINGAKLRAFAYAQKLSLAFTGKLDGEDVAVVHMWEGGTECSGSLTVFSLSPEGVFLSPQIGGCAGAYEVSLAKNDGIDVVQITTFANEDKTGKTGDWTYFDGHLIAE